MEMRKYIIEMHGDGSMTWAEYTNPNNKEDRDNLCSKAMDRVVKELDMLPWAKCSPCVKQAYLSGAASMAKKLCKAF